LFQIISFITNQIKGSFSLNYKYNKDEGISDQFKYNNKSTAGIGSYERAKYFQL